MNLKETQEIQKEIEELFEDGFLEKQLNYYRESITLEGFKCCSNLIKRLKETEPDITSDMLKCPFNCHVKDFYYLFDKYLIRFDRSNPLDYPFIYSYTYIVDDDRSISYDMPSFQQIVDVIKEKKQLNNTTLSRNKQKIL